MFVMTLSKKNLKKAGKISICVAMVAVTILGINSLFFSGDEPSQEVALGLNSQLASAEDLVTFLQGFGVQADVATATVTAVTVPKSWDDSFDAFNEVIEQSGLSLSKSKGKQVDKWALLVPSQSTEDVKSYAIVLVQDNKPVGAYILQKPSGEVLPLSAVEQTGAPLTSEEVAANETFASDAEVIVVADGTDVVQDVAATDDEELINPEATQEVVADIPTE